MVSPATYRDGGAFQWDWEVNPPDASDGHFPTETIFPTETVRPVDPSDPSDGLNPTESIFPTETIRPSDHFFLATYHDALSTAFWEHQYDFRPGKFTPTDYSFNLPGGGAVDPSHSSDGLNPTESIFSHGDHPPSG